MAKGDSTSANNRRRRRGRREKSLAGTHLYRDPKTDKLWWRRTDPLTGKRAPRSTGTIVLEDALKVAQKFEEEYRKKKAGIKTYSEWKKPLIPLVGEWLDHQRSQDPAPGEGWLAQKQRALLRTLEALGLRSAADLTDVARIESRLKKLDLPSVTARRRHQDPLRQFSAYLAGNQRHLDRDPLAAWEPIQFQAQERHRAFMPDEVARGLQASTWLDTIHGRRHSLRPAFVLLLVAMPRKAALISRQVEDFLRDESRINLGKGRPRKGRGQGKLDSVTAQELGDYLGNRRSGPLLLGPRGGRLDGGKVLGWWREAFGLGLTWELWPEGVEFSVSEAHLVNQALLKGKASVQKGGNPKLVSKATRRARRLREAEIQVLADELSEAWHERMEGVTIHAFRHTHQTWAKACGVDQVLINLQAGWSVGRQATDVTALRVARSVGLEHYLDTRSKILDARPSAEAVRGVLDRAVNALYGEGIQASDVGVA
jgi:hypothetical protein